MSGQKPTVFLREATGLVRELSSKDVAFFNFAILGYLFTLYFTLSFIPLIGGDYIWGNIITAILNTFVVYSYYSFHVAMPRSGGDYVFISRVLLPSLGFVCNISWVVILLIYASISGVTIQSTAISVGFALIGSLLHNSALASLAPVVVQPTWMIVLGTLEIVLLGAIAFYRKLYFRLQSFVYILGFIAVFIMIGLFLSNSNASFQSAFNAYSAPYTNSTNYYQGVISLAQKSGWSPPDTKSVYNTILLVPILTIFYGTFIASTYVGGEIKHPRKSSLYGMLVAMWLTCLLTIVVIGVTYNTVGFNFLSALDTLLYAGTLAIPVLPYANFLTLLLTNNAFIIVFVIVAGILQGVVYIPAFYYLGSRSFLAYSFDRVLPSIFARVSDRFHVPTVSIILLIALSEVGFIVLQIPYTAAAIYEFETVLTWYAAITPILIVGIASVLFPYVKKQMFESSPLKTKVGGIPLMTLTGFGTIVGELLIIYLMLTNPVYAANGIGPISMVVVLTVIYFAIYFVAKLYRKREGMPLDLAFKQVPPE